MRAADIRCQVCEETVSLYNLNRHSQLCCQCDYYESLALALNDEIKIVIKGSLKAALHCQQQPSKQRQGDGLEERRHLPSINDMVQPVAECGLFGNGCFSQQKRLGQSRQDRNCQLPCQSH